MQPLTSNLKRNHLVAAQQEKTFGPGMGYVEPANIFISPTLGAWLSFSVPSWISNYTFRGIKFDTAITALIRPRKGNKIRARNRSSRSGDLHLDTDRIKLRPGICPAGMQGNRFMSDEIVAWLET